MARISVAIVGATGYGGAELVRLLLGHPEVEITTVTSGRSAGKPIREECPWLSTDLVLSSFEPTTIDAEIVFLCQEAGFAIQHARTLVERGIKVIDLSADFRLKDSSLYPLYYKFEHSDLDLLAEAVYGLPEIEGREVYAGARLVANPGCHATASQLALAPLARAGVVTPGAVPVIDSKSGVSGAGRSRKETEYLFSELDGGFKSYAQVGHRHTPEIERVVGGPVRFTPHLVPMPRGIMVTAYVPVEGTPNLANIYQEFYANEPFVTYQTTSPSTKQVVGTNNAALSAWYDPRTKMAVVVSVIDNLGKGAAAQAIQSMNILFNLPETAGLKLSGLWP